MSVIYRNDLGAFLDYLPLTSDSILSNKQVEIDDGVTGVPSLTGTVPASESSLWSGSSHSGEVHQAGKAKACFRWKQELFAVDSPFMMNSQADRLKREAINRESGGVMKETSAQRKRRKKSNREIVLSGLEKKISQVISKALPGLIEQARELKCLREILLYPSENNQLAREASQIAGCEGLFPNLCCDFDEERLTDCHTSPDVKLDGGNKIDSHSSSDVIILSGERDPLLRSWLMIGRHICNLDDSVKVIHVDDHPFIIPPRSSFLTSSFYHFVAEGYKQIQVKNGYDLIVIDPPWNNKSVKRKKSYHTVEETDFKHIPVSELAGQDCLICVWVTNNERLKDFVTTELFPHWSVDFIAEWIWLKVTRKGEPICDILSAHKKPYEQLFIGRLTGHSKYPAAESCAVHDIATSAVNSTCLVHTGAESQHDESPDCKSCIGITKEKLTTIPQDFLLTSVPCSLHSKKPSLAGVLSEYLGTNSSCLELFARNLTPGWVSWGNEPLIHQHLDYFEQIL